MVGGEALPRALCARLAPQLGTWAGGPPWRRCHRQGDSWLLQGLPLGGGSGQQHWGLGARRGLPRLPGLAEVHICRVRGGPSLKTGAPTVARRARPRPFGMRSPGRSWVMSRGSLTTPRPSLLSPAGVTPAAAGPQRGGPSPVDPRPPTVPSPPLGKPSKMGCSRAYLSRL